MENKKERKPQKQPSLKECIIALTVIGIILFIISHKVFGYVYAIGTIIYIISLFDKKSKFQLYSKSKKVKTILGYLLLAVIFFSMSKIGANNKNEASKKVEGTTKSTTVKVDGDAQAKKVAEEKALKDKVAAEKAVTDQKAKAENEARVKAETEAEVKAKESKNKAQFKTAIGNLYTGVTLYIQEDGQMLPAFTVLDKKNNVKNEGGALIKNGVLVKEIDSGDTYWKDVNQMIKNDLSKESYVIKYYVKSDDPHLP